MELYTYHTQSVPILQQIRYRWCTCVPRTYMAK